MSATTPPGRCTTSSGSDLERNQDKPLDGRIEMDDPISGGLGLAATRSGGILEVVA
jgi:hypothetical protein